MSAAVYVYSFGLGSGATGLLARRLGAGSSAVPHFGGRCHSHAARHLPTTAEGTREVLGRLALVPGRKLVVFVFRQDRVGAPPDLCAFLRRLALSPEWDPLAVLSVCTPVPNGTSAALLCDRLLQSVLLGRLCLGPARVRLFPLDLESLSGYSQPAGPGPFELSSASCYAIADQIARQMRGAGGEERPGRLLSENLPAVKNCFAFRQRERRMK